MKTFRDQCAQGDVFFRRIDKLPKDAIAVEKKSKNTPVVVAHSETGHDHQFTRGIGVTLFTTPNPLVCYLKLDEPTQLDHMRSFDTHEPIMFDSGVFEIRRQREYTPEGWRRVED
jgi:hypothetical protein